MVQFLLSSAIVFLGAYILGSIPFGYLIGRFNGIDIRKFGSHNIGATNVTRVLGALYGRFCFFLDFMKGLLAVLVVGESMGARMAVGPGWGGVIAAAAVVIGHMYPVWLGFRGGKGVSTSIGALLALAFWPILLSLAVWYAAYRKTLIVSIASLASAVAAPILAIVMRFTKLEHVHWPTIAIMFFISGLVVWRHRENIVRLYRGEENAFKKK